MNRIFITLFFFANFYSYSAFAITAEDAFKRASGGDVLIEVTDKGLSDSEVKMKVRQGMLFILNNTHDSLLTFEFDFGGAGPACYTSVTPNLEFKEGGKLVSTQPLQPGNFAASCFAELGEFTFTVYGLEKYPKGLKGKLIVTLM